MVLPPVPLANYGALAVAQTVAKAIRPFAPSGFLTGGLSYYDGPATVRVCDNGGAWRAVWARHTRTEYLGSRDPNTLNPPPEVDFGTSFVVAVFGGPVRNVVGYRVVGGYALGAQSTVRLAPNVDPSPAAAVALPTPWAFMVLPRPKDPSAKDAAVAIQMPDGAGGWRTVARAKPER